MGDIRARRAHLISDTFLKCILREEEEEEEEVSGVGGSLDRILEAAIGARGGGNKSLQNFPSSTFVVFIIQQTAGGLSPSVSVLTACSTGTLKVTQGLADLFTFTRRSACQERGILTYRGASLVQGNI